MFKIIKSNKNKKNSKDISVKIKDNFISTLQVTGLWALYSGSALGLTMATQTSNKATQQALIVLVLVYVITMAIMKKVFIRSKQYKRLNKEQLQRELEKYEDEE